MPERRTRARCTGYDFMHSLKEGGDPCGEPACVNVRVWLGAAVADLILCNTHKAYLESFCRERWLAFIVEKLP